MRAATAVPHPGTPAPHLPALPPQGVSYVALKAAGRESDRQGLSPSCCVTWGSYFNLSVS